MPTPKTKIRIAIVSLTSCEGCEVAVLDLGERLIEILSEVELTHFKYMMEGENDLKECDIAFVEGSPTSKRDMELLKKVREKAKKIIALGHCAHLGGIQKIKNYRGKEKILKKIYNEPGSVDNNAGAGINKYVKVDGVIPGCPINKEEFLKCYLNTLAGKDFKIAENPVCYECLNNDYECELQKGKICLGPIALGGCEAMCLRSGQACWGCRGFLPEVLEAPQSHAGDCDGTSGKLKNLRNKLKEIANEKDLENITEIFGLR